MVKAQTLEPEFESFMLITSHLNQFGQNTASAKGGTTGSIGKSGCED